jgi:cytochrome c-type biogenesis protein CcmH/NrfG
MPPQHSVVVSNRRSLETISIGAFFTTLIVALFIFIPSSATPLVTTKAYLLSAGTLITLALYILARLSRGNVIFPPIVLVGALWLPMIAYTLSSVFSGSSFANALWGTSLETDTLGFILAITFFGTLSALILRRSENYRSFLSVGAWVFGILALLQTLVVVVGQISPATISPAFSVVGSFTDLAFILGLGLIGSLITFRFVELSKNVRRGLLISSILGLFLLAIANSSLVWVLVALVALGFFVESVMRRGPKGSETDLDETSFIDEAPSGKDEGSRSLILPLITLVVSLFFLIGGTLGGALANSLHVNVLNVRPSWQSTYSVAQKTFTTDPLFGTGPNTFGVEWLKYRDTSLNSTVFWNLQFLSGVGYIPTSLITTGLFGVLAWVIFLALFIGLGLRSLIRRAPQDAYVRYVAILSFIATVYLFTIAFFDLPNAIVLTLAFVFAGLFASTTRYGAQSKQWGVIFSRSPRIGFVVVFSLTLLLLASVVVAYSLTEHYIATKSLAQAQVAFANGDFESADSIAQSSVAFAQSAFAYQVQAGVAMARLNQIMSSSTLPKAQAQQMYQTILSSGINAALTATNLDPSNVQSWLVLGNLYSQAVPLTVKGAYDSAKTAYDKARLLDPTNPQIPYIMAQLNIANKDIKKAQEDLKIAIALKQDYTDAIFLLSQLEVQSGNIKEALEASLAAAYFTPNNPNILFQVGILSAAQGDLNGAGQALTAAVTANPQFANARYFLAAIYAKQGNLAEARAQIQAIADISVENATSVAPLLTALEAGKNPFPENLLSIPSVPVK